MKVILVLSALLVSFNVYGQVKSVVKYGNNREAGKYVKVNGINMYYETYGSGRPLIFLHGNGGSIRGAGSKIDYFKKYFKVIAIDSRGNGKSIDTSTKELSYAQMAYDVKVLLDSIQVDSAYISGQSDGGILGLIMAIKYPGKISKLVTFGANIFPGKKAIFDEMDRLIKNTLKTTKNIVTRQNYLLLDQQPNITEKELNGISCPVLVVQGDRDIIRAEHGLKIFNAIPNSNFFVMPGSTHFGSVEKPELFNSVVMEFFTKPFAKPSAVELFTGKH